MATTTVINTTRMAHYFGTDGSETKIAHTTDASISITHAPRDITSKDSQGWRELLEGLRSASGSASFYMLGSGDGAYTLHDFYQQCINSRQTIHVIFKTDDASDISFEGDAYITSVEITSSGAEDNVSVSVAFDFTGEIDVLNT